MPDFIWVVAVLVVAVGGGVLGFYISTNAVQQKLRASREEAERLRAQAEAEKKDLILHATQEAMTVRGRAEEEVRERRQELQRIERRLTQKEENLDRKVEQNETRERQLVDKEQGLDGLKADIEKVKDRQLEELQRVAELTTIEAKDTLLKMVEQEIREDANRRLIQLEKAYREDAGRRSREILVEAIQRVTSEVISDTTTSVVPIPSDDMKGRIIGREGRNIRALEHATGVDIIIDDTPDAVTLSCFDPVRREIARLSLSKLVTDGRIHPTRIEEVVERAKAEVDQVIIKEGERAIYEAGLPDIHPELAKYLGRLKFRYSYGQNVLEHSVESTKFAGIIASELGANVNIVKKGALLHDIGKGMDHEMEGPHALIGASLVERYEKSREVVICVAKHHDDWFTNTLEGSIVQVADAISGGRPGARAESMDRYVKRLQALEEIANGYPGVEKSYAVQAGRELRILVKPSAVDDLGAMRMARDIARKVEESLEYPGQIKVTVVREIRAIEYAQ
ncbi:MAG: ribonuclease Y [Dehalococcoidia bacterium]|nr:ribonuclease Y [Dehalococcoidia bacterium]